MDFVINQLASHFPIIGWLIFLFIVGKLGWRASKLFTNIENALARTEHVETVVNAVATNHLPHIEKAINDMKDDVVNELKSLQQNLLILFGREK